MSQAESKTPATNPVRPSPVPGRVPVTAIPVTRIPTPGSKPAGMPATRPAGGGPAVPPGGGVGGASAGGMPPGGRIPPGPGPSSPAAPAAPSMPAGMPPIAELKGRPLGRILQKMGRVTREQYTEALNFQKQKGGALGRLLIDLGYIKEGDLNVALAAQQGFEVISLEGINIDAGDHRRRSRAARHNEQGPPDRRSTRRPKPLTVAMASHENFRALDDLRSLMQYQVTAKIASDPDLLEKLIAKHYQAAAEGTRRNSWRASGR